MKNAPRIVPSVRALIADDQNRILVIRRANTRFGEGRWCLPGGKIDYGETAEQAVIKEISEEMSLRCTSCDFFCYRDGLPSGLSDMHCPTVFFECRTSGKIKLNDESSAFAWISPNELGEFNLLFHHDEVVKAFWEVRSSQA
ncbi:NUDIX hydrolase [bacterium]|nr:NUDIX hydrolase [bacterium]